MHWKYCSQVIQTVHSLVNSFCLYHHVKVFRSPDTQLQAYCKRILENLVNPKIWKILYYKIFKILKQRRFVYLLLCLRLSVPLFQEIVALGKAFGLHSITISPPTWTTEYFLRGVLEKSGAEAKNKITELFNYSSNQHVVTEELMQYPR